MSDTQRIVELDTSEAMIGRAATEDVRMIRIATTRTLRRQDSVAYVLVNDTP